MTNDFDLRVKAVFDEIVDRTPELGAMPATVTTSANHDAQNRRPWLAVAASVVIIGGLGALFLVRSQDSGTPQIPAATFTTPTSTDNVADEATQPVVLEPNADEVRVDQRARIPGSDYYTGAVVSPGGVVYGIGLTPTRPFEQPEGFEQRTVAGLSAWSLVDGLRTENVYRGVEVDCATLGVVTAGEPRWTDDAEALMQSVEVIDDAVVLNLPEGWTSLGVARVDEVFRTTMTVTYDGVDSKVSMLQAAGAPVGLYLLPMETNPVPVNGNDPALWYLASAATGGQNAMVGILNGTSFAISGRVPRDALTGIVDSMVAADNETLRNVTTNSLPSRSTSLEAEETTNNCVLDRLEVHEQ